MDCSSARRIHPPELRGAILDRLAVDAGDAEVVVLQCDHRPMSADDAPFAQVVRFYPRRGLSYRLEKDHLALDDADATLCGIALGLGRSSGTHHDDTFDPSAPYACRRCVTALRRHGPVQVRWRTSYSQPFSVDLVAAPAA